jgi:hypothetical protein
LRIVIEQIEEIHVRPAVSTALTSIIMTRTFFCLAKTDLTGQAMSPGESAAVATWYSGGWNR